MGTIRYCSQIKSLNHILAVSNHNIGQGIVVTGRYKSYSKDKDCCRDVPQTEGKTVVPWPRTPMWPCNFPEEPQPPNYDPYKIKSPDVVVPPLPPSNAKRTGFVFVTSGHHQDPTQGYPGYPQQQHHHQPPHMQTGIPHGDMEQDVEKEQEPKGFFTTLKELLGWKKKDTSGRDSMIAKRILKLQVETYGLRARLSRPTVQMLGNRVLLGVGSNRLRSFIRTIGSESR
ncbi:hypothetical protein RR48_04197 [Papilio machaon]|uniref:Uncharacterized protein n=1 Tax=Papilio machaon TaxID=76193 RepID=A0A0N0PBT9_PAPMA|nr:hypothetical protein RR48_04197 [Papilio machaon]